MEHALKDALERSAVVLCSGGLGPTFDDLTRECASKVLKKPLIFSQKILDRIQAKFKAVGRPMAAENARQAYVLKGASPIINSVGTAPGQIIPVKAKTVFLLPGPPSELAPMMDSTVLPFLRKKSPNVFSKTLVLHIFGYPESEIDEVIEPVISRNWNSPGVAVIFGILAHRSIIDVKVTVQSKSSAADRKVLADIRKALYGILGDKIYGEDEETLESVVGSLLKKKGLILSLAESCTGGLLASKITRIAGSSDYFHRGLITYSDASKIDLLGVKHQTLKKFGAVSEETAREMALGCLKRSGSNWALSVTGIAGPSGGSKEKPVGTVCFGVASRAGVKTFTKHFNYGGRAQIQERAALTALDTLRKAIRL